MRSEIRMRRARSLGGRVDRWEGRPDDAPEKTVEALAQVAASRGPEQGLYLWVADGSVSDAAAG